MSLVEKAAQRLRERSDQDTPGPQRAAALDPAPAAEPHAPTEPAPIDGNSALSLNIPALQRAGLVPPDEMRERMGREYQRVKRPILRAIADNPDDAVGPNRLMITSAKPGEGKSFTSLNLAMSLAQELDHSVLLVDGDVVSPRLSRAFGVNKDLGLTDTLLNAELEAAQVIRTTDTPRLSFMPAGCGHDQATELIASRRMRRLMEELAEDESRIVIFDSAPLLATADAQALALHMGQIVFVVKASHTERRALESALSLVDHTLTRTSLLLNQSNNSFGDGYDGYYGSYGYGNGAHGTSQG